MYRLMLLLSYALSPLRRGQTKNQKSLLKNGGLVPTPQRRITQKVQKALQWSHATQYCLAALRSKQLGKRCHRKAGHTLPTITLKRLNVVTPICLQSTS